MIGITQRLYLLGQALAGQGDDESADPTFRLAISTGLKYFGPDDPLNIQAQKAYSEYLYSRNLTQEADQIERLVDSGLKSYRLTLSGTG